MPRPLLLWLSFLACAVLLFGALGLVTRHAVGQDVMRREAEAEAERGQRVRLALWRMDSVAAGFLVAENNRPPAWFRPAGVEGLPEHVRLHFEVDDAGVFHSPQIPPPGTGDGDAESARRRAAGTRLAGLLGVAPESPKPPPPQAVVPQQAALPQEQGLGIPNVTDGDMPPPANRPARDGVAAQQSLARNANLEKAFAAAQSVEELPTADALVAKDKLSSTKGAAKGMAKPKAKEEQAYLNELNTRAGMVQKAVTQAALPPPMAKSRMPAAKPEAAPREAMPQPAGGSLGFGVVGDAAEAAPAPQVDASLNQASPVVQAPAGADARPVEAAVATIYQSLWLDGELLLVRSVTRAGKTWVQGVWLDKAGLRESLLAGIRDLLPDATMRPYQPVEFSRDNALRPDNRTAAVWRATPKNLDNAPLSMVSLPWELVPGWRAETTAAMPETLRLLLGTAWGAAALALLAAAVMLRGVMSLSERRASFVSSVTHELRTPLTTFRLYSEMLADGMVRDEEKKLAYLQTLRTEAGRLAHLVENVLAYSRIERGSARSRPERTTVGDLAARILPRLRERAEAAGLDVLAALPDDVAAIIIDTDLTAVEQILFNLVDNAAKYAAPPTGGAVLEMDFARAGGNLIVTVADHGPGIAAGERRKLFRPFHKSAREAAHGKPGVGLGLSLSRRLARALGGDLSLLPARDPGPTGARFALRLPVPRDRPPPPH